MVCQRLVMHPAEAAHHCNTTAPVVARAPAEPRAVTTLLLLHCTATSAPRRRQHHPQATSKQPGAAAPSMAARPAPAAVTPCRGTAVAAVSPTARGVHTITALALAATAAVGVCARRLQDATTQRVATALPATAMSTRRLLLLALVGAVKTTAAAIAGAAAVCGATAQASRSMPWLLLLLASAVLCSLGR